VTSATDVILKPFIQLTITGTSSGMPGAKNDIVYAVPLTDELTATGLGENEELLTDDLNDLDNWNAPLDRVQVNPLIDSQWGPHQGGAILSGVSDPDAIDDPDTPGKKIKSVFMIMDMIFELNDAWNRGDGYLSYDVQVKHAWDPVLTAAMDGICVRWHRPIASTRYQGLGVSFISYTGIGPGFTDYIPDSIKPPDLAGEPLLVVWEQQVVGASVSRRWLAYKNLNLPTPDTYVLGGQGADDGRVFNDLSSLFVRIEERDVNGIKTNSLRVFYADASALPARSSVMGNDSFADRNRWVYPPSWAAGSPGIVWPVNNLSD